MISSIPGHAGKAPTCARICKAASIPSAVTIHPTPVAAANPPAAEVAQKRKPVDALHEGDSKRSRGNASVAAVADPCNSQHEQPDPGIASDIIFAAYRKK
eukprot:4523400-Pyramimonas_sp.AAC.1